MHRPVRSCLPVLFALLFLLALPPAPATAGDTDGPPDSWTRYWTVPGFPSIPMRGPDKAKGVVFWSHGVNGKWPEYQHPPAVLIQSLAADGWDVVKVNRNNLFETGWADAGLRHVDDLVQRAEDARRQGYKRVIAAGQSYGAAISLEAGTRHPFDAVIALAPGTGSDALNSGANTMRWQSQAGWLERTLRKERAARVFVFVPDQDEYFPSATRGPLVREGLRRSGRAFAIVDESSPLKGHGAGTGSTFRGVYGNCLKRLIETATPPAGETRCPNPPADYDILLPDDLAIAPPGAGVPKTLAAFSARWTGTYTGNQRNVVIAVERIESSGAQILISIGRGPDRTLPADWTRRKAVFEGDRVMRTSGGDNRFTLTLRPDGKADLLWESKDGSKTLTAVMTPVRG